MVHDHPRKVVEGREKTHIDVIKIFKVHHFRKELLEELTMDSGI